ncbi:MAG: UDP-N-acetylmuramoylalanine--D-glutamate ligase [bacterium]|nr:MAG: UDP-N-acetylmuramoylalanine--D-glutamate ligase [bacterium]
MNFLQQLKREHILVVGFGYRTGLSTSNYLMDKGIKVSISDSQNEKDLKSLKDQLIGPLQHFYCGKQSSNQLDDIDRVILSPGVPRAIPLIHEALRRGLSVTSEIELAFLLCHPKMIIGITGTDGKTTTTTLLNDLLKGEFKVFMGGNIGIPFISFVDQVDDKSIVLLELSSYQLEDMPLFNCHIASVLNVSEDHLDRYNHFQDYLNAKKNIFKNQTDQDYAILNLDDPHYETISKGIKGQILLFSQGNSNADVYINASKIVFKGREVVSLVDIKLKGVHNLENILSAVSMAKLAGSSDSVIQKVLNEFRGLPHRNELIDTIGEVDYINDSKATTINSVIKSLLSQDKPIILMMGGRDKGLNFSELKPHIDEKLKVLILFGEAKEKIDRKIQFHPTYLVGDLEEAFHLALQMAKGGDSVLLSPGCTSFDQYVSYEKRGDHFRELVNSLHTK